MNDKNRHTPVEGGPLELDEIMRLIPHRYPFLLVDRVLSYRLEPERVLTAIKNVTINEPFFQGHFPDQPVMPGVLIIEAMAQACGVLGSLMHADNNEELILYYLAKIEKARFSKMVVPGDQLVMEVRETWRRRRMGHFECTTLVDGIKVASVEMVCAGKA